MKTLLFHIHTEKSFDSNIKIIDLLDFVAANKIDYLCVTDHDNYEGYNIIKKLIKEKRYKKINLVMGAEIKTEYGDVIPCFIKKPISTKNFLEVVNETRKQKGLLIIPHPLVTHGKIDYILKYVDGIEVFNSGSLAFQNKDYYKLAEKHPKLIRVAGSDCHTLKEVGNALNTIKFGRKIEIRPLKMRQSGFFISKIKQGRNILFKRLEKLIRK